MLHGITSTTRMVGSFCWAASEKSEWMTPGTSSEASAIRWLDAAHVRPEPEPVSDASPQSWMMSGQMPSEPF